MNSIRVRPGTSDTQIETSPQDMIDNNWTLVYPPSE